MHQVGHLQKITPVITLWAAKLNVHKFDILPTKCIYVFCMQVGTTFIQNGRHTHSQVSA